MKKLLAIIPLLVLAISLIPMTIATEEVPLMIIGISNPMEGDTVSGIVPIMTSASSPSPFSGDFSPIRLIISGEHGGMVVLTQDMCSGGVSANPSGATYGAQCIYYWDTNFFPRNGNAQISAFSSNEGGQHVSISIDVDVRNSVIRPTKEILRH